MTEPLGPGPALEPVALDGRVVRLRPMGLDDVEALAAAGADPEVFRWYVAPVPGVAGMRAWVEDALRAQAAGLALPFVTVACDTGAVIGSTRFGSYDRPNRCVEIGWTWLTPSSQRTAANTEAKYLMLRHAFESWNLDRVEFKTDSLNQKSRAALARIGAVQEGIFRRRRLCHDGRWRDDVWFSVIAPDWPKVKAGLEARLAPR